MFASGWFNGAWTPETTLIVIRGMFWQKAWLKGVLGGQNKLQMNEPTIYVVCVCAHARVCVHVRCWQVFLVDFGSEFSLFKVWYGMDV